MIETPFLLAWDDFPKCFVFLQYISWKTQAAESQKTPTVISDKNGKCENGKVLSLLPLSELCRKMRLNVAICSFQNFPKQLLEFLQSCSISKLVSQSLLHPASNWRMHRFLHFPNLLLQELRWRHEEGNSHAPLTPPLKKSYQNQFYRRIVFQCSCPVFDPHAAFEPQDNYQILVPIEQFISASSGFKASQVLLAVMKAVPGEKAAYTSTCLALWACWHP